MKGIQEFKIDVWSRDIAPKSKTYLASSYASAISLDDLQTLGADLATTGHTPIDPSLALSYAPSYGTPALRQRIAELHSGAVALTADDVVITPGSIMANYLVLTTVCVPGDHIVCQYPTYGQLYLLPKYLGVEVTLWEAKEENGWAMNVDELAGLIRPNTKAIVVNNPCNPTGFVFSQQQCQKLVDVARQSNLVLISDEVFSPLFYDITAPPLASLGYPRVISTGSVSKAHGLPGIRIGWVVTQDAELMEAVATARDYTTLNVSRLDDGVALFALDPKVLPRIMQRNIGIMKESISLIQDIVGRNPERLSWTRPAGGGTAFIKVRHADGTLVDDVEFSTKLLEEQGIAVIPGHHCFSEPGVGGFEGYIRINLGESQRLRDCQEVLESFVRRY
jgi:aspartate/methionine/tyrosine aminotransferase